jgi:hypothetical protein
LDARIDALMNEIKSGMEGRPEPPDSAGGGDIGSSNAGIIDGDESDSAKDGF